MRLFIYDKTKRRNLFILLAVCFFIRIGYQWINLNIPFFKVSSHGVVIDKYGTIAVSLAQGDGYSFEGVPTALVPPLYPVVLGTLYKFLGIWHGYGLILQAFCDTLSCLFIFLLAYRVLSSYQHAFLAALLWTVYIPGMSFSVLLYSEPLFIALLTSFCYSLLVVKDKPTAKKWGLLGVQLGLLFLCRPSALFLFPMILLYLTFNLLKSDKYTVVLIMLLSFGLIVSPWIIRNYLHSKRWIIGSTLLGYTLCSTRDLIDKKELVQELRALRLPRGILLEYEKDLVYRKYFWIKVKENPTMLLTGGIKRIVYIYLHRLNSFKAIVFLCTNFLFLVLGMVSILRYRGQWLKSFAPFWWFLGYFHLMAIFPGVHWRHNMPNIPFLIILAMPAISGILHFNAEEEV